MSCDLILTDIFFKILLMSLLKLHYNKFSFLFSGRPFSLLLCWTKCHIGEGNIGKNWGTKGEFCPWFCPWGIRKLRPSIWQLAKTECYQQPHHLGTRSLSTSAFTWKSALADKMEALHRSQLVRFHRKWRLMKTCCL